MGSVYRLEVVPEHAASDGLPNVIDVELPRRDFRALDLAVGERVYLRPTETHWFEAGQIAAPQTRSQ
jgi:sulfate transport system ATP-binding protein